MEEMSRYRISTKNGIDSARYAILEYKNGSWLPEMITISYNYQKAAEQARKNGRLDWEVGIQSGFMPQKKQTNIDST